MDSQRGRGTSPATGALLARDPAGSRQRRGPGFWRTVCGALTLVPLTLVALGAWTGSARAVQDDEAQRWPLYRQALDLVARASVEGAAAGELRQLAQRLEEEGCGFEPLDVDRVLASAWVLGALAPRSVEPLSDLVLRLEELLREDPQAEPMLALAFGRGLAALGATPVWPELPERAELLRLALEHLARLEPSVERDELGIHLCLVLWDEIGSQATEPERAALEEGLVTFTTGSAQRLALLARVASERAGRGEYGRAWRLIFAAGEFASLPGEAPVDRARAERTLVGARCQLELACGLVDEAMASLARERDLLAAGADDLESREGFLLDLSAAGFQQELRISLLALLEEFDRALALWSDSWRDSPRTLARLRARRAVLQHRYEALTGGPGRAHALLAAACADEELDADHRSVAGLLLIDLWLETKRASEAESLLGELSRRAEADLSPEIRLGILARRLDVAHVRGVDAEERARLLASGRAAFEQHLASFAGAPLRTGGLGLMAGSSRQRLLGALLELSGEEPGTAQLGFELLARLHAAGSLARMVAGSSEVPLVTLAEVRALLPEGSGMLVYARTGRGAHVLWLDREGLGVEPIQGSYRARARELRDELARTPHGLSPEKRQASAARLDALAGDLSGVLLPDEVRTRLARWKGVYWMGEDVLAGVPLDCLPLAGAPLWRTHDVSSLPSLSVGVLLARKQRPPSTTFLTCAATEPESPQVEDLELSADDRARLGLAPGDLLGAQATWPALAELLRRGGASGLHILAHGLPDWTREVPIGLALARAADDDGNLWMEELLAAEVEFPWLVVLSACKTARGPQRVGDDGLARLVGGFFARGACVVLHAQNDIALDATLLSVERIRRAYLDGASPAGALRLARAALCEVPELDHPFYLYALRVSGLGLVAGPEVERK